MLVMIKVVIALKMSECVFCKIVKGEVPAEVVWASEDFIAILDANPKSDGHTLVIPKRHCVKFGDLPEELYSGLFLAVKGVVERMNLENYNIFVNNGKVAGQVVGHFHMHILPRKEGDGFTVVA